jgi:hypothetical protein
MSSWYPAFWVSLLICFLSRYDHGGAFAAPTTTPVITPSATTMTTTPPAPTISGAPLTPAPPTLSREVSRADLIFTFFAQDDAAVQEYRRTLNSLLNVTLRRVTFESTGQNRYGYLFGDHVRVRVRIEPPVISENEQNPSAFIRDALVGLAVAQDTRLTDLGIVSGEAVDSLFVFTYATLTAWDIIWTLVIIAGALLFVGFVAFVAYRFHRWRANARHERELEAKEKEVAAIKQKAHAHGTNPAAVAAAAEAETKMYDDSDDGDEAGDDAMAALVADLARTMKNSSMDRDGRSLSPAQSAIYNPGAPSSAGFTAPTDRVPLDMTQLGPTSIHGRDALAMHTAHQPPPQARSAVNDFLASIHLPPVTGNASYIPGVDEPPSPNGAGSPNRGRDRSPSRFPRRPSQAMSRTASSAEVLRVPQRQVDFDDALL